MKKLLFLCLCSVSSLGSACDLDSALVAAKKEISNQLKSQGVNSYFLNIGFNLYPTKETNTLVIPYYYSFNGTQLTSTVDVDMQNCNATAFGGMPSDEFQVE